MWSQCEGQEHAVKVKAAMCTPGGRTLQFRVVIMLQRIILYAAGNLATVLGKPGVFSKAQGYAVSWDLGRHTTQETGLSISTQTNLVRITG